MLASILGGIAVNAGVEMKAMWTPAGPQGVVRSNHHARRGNLDEAPIRKARLIAQLEVKHKIGDNGDRRRDQQAWSVLRTVAIKVLRGWLNAIVRLQTEPDAPQPEDQDQKEMCCAARPEKRVRTALQVPCTSELTRQLQPSERNMTCARGSVSKRTMGA